MSSFWNSSCSFWIWPISKCFTKMLTVAFLSNSSSFLHRFVKNQEYYLASLSFLVLLDSLFFNLFLHACIGFYRQSKRILVDFKRPYKIFSIFLIRPFQKFVCMNPWNRISDWLICIRGYLLTYLRSLDISTYRQTTALLLPRHSNSYQRNLLETNISYEVAVQFNWRTEINLAIIHVYLPLLLPVLLLLLWLVLFLVLVLLNWANILFP